MCSMNIGRDTVHLTAVSMQHFRLVICFELLASSFPFSLLFLQLYVLLSSILGG